MVNIPNFIFIDDSTITRINMPNVIRSEMENGPAKTRPINSVPMFNYEFSVSINKSKFNEFRQWFINDIYRGTSWFTMKDPLSGILIKVKFSAPDELEWSKMGNLLVSSFTLEGYDEL